MEESKYEALRYVLTQRRNRLRKLPRKELLDACGYNEIFKFRDLQVVTAAFARNADDDAICVIIRGYVHPYCMTRHWEYHSFVKLPDDEWIPGPVDDPHHRAVFAGLWQDAAAIPMF